MASPPVSISSTPLLAGSVSTPDAAAKTDFRLDAIDPTLLAPPCFFWESPEGECVSLIGAAARRQFPGPEPWVEARSWLRGAAKSIAAAGGEPGAPPLAFGGFGFDGGPAPAWGLPAGVVLIPELQWRRDAEGRTSLTSWVEQEPDRSVAEGVSPPASGDPECFVEEWTHSDWSRAVGWALERIEAGRVEKVVLARSRVARVPRALDMARAFAAFREAYPACLRYLFWDESGGVFIGASPERLVSLREGRVRADAVAGTARLGEGGGDAARALLDDPKERREHEVVVREVLAALRAVCEDASAPPEPTLLTLRQIAHLRTPVTASAPAGTHVLDLVSRIHPTPAVAGTPRDEALKLIRVLEPRGRGWYAGPIGWMTPDGDGDFAVGIRSAFVRGDRALLYAGAGIVAGSRPDREWEECEAKLRSIEDVLLRG